MRIEFIKNSSVILYLLLIFTAGIAGLFGKFYFWPWDNWAMFASYPSAHREIVARVTKIKGGTERLTVDYFFPMDSTFIERGGGIGIESVVSHLLPSDRAKAYKKLCNFLLRKYNNSVRTEESIVQVDLIWEFTDFNNTANYGAEPLATCSL